jgi:long-chain acyl-CoA synthetase
MYPDNLSLGSIDKSSYRYSELKEYILSVSAFLKNNGIEKGDRVVILSESSPNWGIAFFAITSLGAIAVPIMTEFQPEEIAYIIQDSGAKGIFVSDKCKVKLDVFEIAKLDVVVLLDEYSIVNNDKLKSFIVDDSDTINSVYEKIDFSSDNDDASLWGNVSEDDIASLIYTSGTTGHSKGVLLSHKNFVTDAIATVELSGVKSDDIMLSILPLSHTMECNVGMVTAVIAGAQIYYLDKPPTATVLLPALKKVRPTIMVSIPLIIEKIFRQKIKPEFEKSSSLKFLYGRSVTRKLLNKAAGKKLMETFGGRLRMFCIGGAALPQDVEDFLIEANFPYTMGYGLTECSPLVSGDPPATRRYRSSGRPIRGVQVKINNPDKHTKMGEIVVKGPNVFHGYYKDEEATKQIFTNDGWFKTGDLGILDKDGYLFIKDRIKNVIVGSNGKNIYPEEIESKINDLQYVAESLVLQKDERLVARVHLNYPELEEIYKNLNLKKAQFNEKINSVLADILVQVNKKLPSYSKVVKVFEQNEPFAKTPTLKIKRFLYNG